MMDWQKIVKYVTGKGFTGEANAANVKEFLKTKLNMEGLDDGDGKPIDIDASYSASLKAKQRGSILDDDGSNETPEMKAATEEAAKKSKAQQRADLADYGANQVGRDRYDVQGGEPAVIKMYDARVKRKNAAFSSGENAAAFMASLRNDLATKHKDAAKLYSPAMKAFDTQILQKAGIFPNSAGGALVPVQYSTDLIRLTEEYGVARRNSMMVPMQGEYIKIPRQTGFTTGSWAGEAVAPTTTEATFNNIDLIANTRGLVVRASNELMNDASLSYADIVARDAARDFGQAEDDALFNGNGDSNYGGFVGLAGRFRNVLETAGGTWATDAGNLAGVVVAAGNTSDEGTYANLVNMWAKLPVYAQPGAKWYCSQYMYANYFLRLVGQPAASGLSWDFVTGSPVMTMFGKPIEVVQKMATAEGNSQFNVYLGDLRLATKFGEVTGSMEITSSEHFYFTTREIAIRANERVAINVHDVGNYSATAALRVPGPVIGLLSAAS